MSTNSSSDDTLGRNTSLRLQDSLFASPISAHGLVPTMDGSGLISWVRPNVRDVFRLNKP